MADVLARGFETFKTLVRIRIVPFHIDPNLCGPPVIGNVDSGHAHKPNPRIGQFSFDQSFDLLAECFTDPAAMVLEPALLQTRTSGKTDENNRKLAVRVGALPAGALLLSPALAEFG